jgi:hypothetical protein
MAIKDWKFTTLEGLTFDEYTDYPEDIKQIAIDLKMPENALSCAKVAIFNDGLTGVTFILNGIELSLPPDKILTFNPFIRAICDGLSGGSSDTDSIFYFLDGVEYPLKKNSPNLTLHLHQPR